MNAPALTELGCSGRLDLWSRRDLSSRVLVCPVGDTYKVVPYFRMPAENVRGRERRDRLPYSMWIRQGVITATKGSVTDDGVIREQIVNDIARRFDIEEIAFDPYGAAEIVNK